jgi:hypothetical protein
MKKTITKIVLSMLTMVLVPQANARMSAADLDAAGRYSMQSTRDVDRGNCCDEARWWVSVPKRAETSSRQSAGLAAGNCLELSDEHGRTALHLATIRGSRKGVRLLLAAGAAVDATDNRGQTPLHLAAMLGYWEIVEALLDAGADAEAVGHSPRTRTHAATAERGLAAIRALVMANARSSG